MRSYSLLEDPACAFLGAKGLSVPTGQTRGGGSARAKHAVVMDDLSRSATSDHIRDIQFPKVPRWCDCADRETWETCSTPETRAGGPSCSQLQLFIGLLRKSLLGLRLRGLAAPVSTSPEGACDAFGSFSCRVGLSFAWCAPRLRRGGGTTLELALVGWAKAPSGDPATTRPPSGPRIHAAVCTATRVSAGNANGLLARG